MSNATSEKLLLKCSVPGCPRKKRVAREGTDPLEAVTITLRCPWHDNGDFDEATFYDKGGKSICWSPES